MSAKASPGVSILTPTYNHESTIAECVRSVLAQSRRDWELLVLDDGSTDRTAEVVRSFRDPRIRHLPQTHLGLEGLVRTYNRGLAEARGELIAVLEGDDFWPSDKLERQIPAFKDNEVVLAYGLARRVVAGKAQGYVKCGLGRWPRRTLENRPVGSILRMLLSLDGHTPPAVTVMVRKEALQEAGGFRSSPGLGLVDFPTWLHLALRGRFAFVESTLGYWRRHPGQAMKTRALEIQLKLADYALGFYRDALSEEVRRSFGLTPGWMEARLDECRGFGHFQQGRFLLLEGRWSPARESFREALGSRSSRIRALAALGLGASLVRTDLELLARLSGRGHFPLEARP